MVEAPSPGFRIWRLLRRRRFDPSRWRRCPRADGSPGSATFALLPALFEETLHRGYLRRIAFRGLPTPVAYMLIAFLFAIAHGRPGQVITLVLFSVVLNLTVDLCRSLWPGILLHATNNALLTIPGFGGTFRSSAWLAPGGVCLLLGLGLLVVARRRER